MPRPPSTSEDSQRFDELRALAEAAARAGGEVARRRFNTPFNIERKADGSEVSDADHEAQAAIIALLHKTRPGDAFLAEETLDAALFGAPPPAPADDVFTWIIDPIDGTRNYVRGIPFYTCSVGVMRGGFPVAGAIFDPERDELFSISRGEALLVNGSPVQPVDEKGTAGRSRKPLVALPSMLAGRPGELVHAWRGRIVNRNFGSTALHLAMVAAGRLQATLISDSRLWDIAAGWPMLEAVGGLITDLHEGPLFPLDVSAYGGEALQSLAAATPQIHADLFSA